VSGTGIVAALAAEARTLGPAQRTGSAINTLPDGTLLITSGMGPEAAACAALALVTAGARAVLSFGLAGGLDPALQAGTVLIPDAVTDGSGALHTTFGPWRDRLAALCDSAASVRGTLLSVTAALTTAAAKAQARARTGACAVDMESFAIGSVAARAGVHFAIARVVVDTAVDTLPHSVLLATGPRGQMHYARLALGLLRSPAEIPALLQLSQRYRIALRSLRLLAQRGVGP
jgi:adenosylhomocysteine nucleosidase